MKWAKDEAGCLQFRIERIKWQLTFVNKAKISRKTLKINK